MTLKHGLARTYIWILFTVVASCLLVTLFVNAGSIAGFIPQNARLSEALLVGSLAAMFTGCSVAKERNVWRNEFKSCPRWLQGLVIVLAAYGYLVALAQVFFLEGGQAVLEDTVSASAFSLGFEGISFCVIYSFLFSQMLDKPEFIRRSRNSFVLLVVVATIVLVIRSGFFSDRRV